jgi:hypothetical protein
MRNLAQIVEPVFELAERDHNMFNSVLITLLKPDLERWQGMAPFMCHAAEWAVSGFPVLEVSARQANAWAFSDIAEAEIATWRLPWRGLVLQMASPFSPHCMHTMAVYQVRTRWSGSERRGIDGLYQARYDCDSDLHRGELWQVNRTAEALLWSTLESLDEARQEERWACHDQLEAVDVRVSRLCTRILLNAMVEATIPASYKPVKVVKMRKRGKNGKPRHITTESKSTFAFTREVQIDCEQYVNDYVSNDRARVLKTRWITRGHWAQQACGKGRADRKLIYREPHPNCRHDLPLAQHVYRIEEETNTTQPEVVPMGEERASGGDA